MSHTEERLRDENISNQGIKKYEKEVIDLDDNIEHDTLTMKLKIQTLATEYEELHNTTGYPAELSNICSVMCSRWDKLGRSHLKDYTVECLDSRFKRVKSEHSTSQLSSAPDYLPEECSAVYEHYKSQANDLLKLKTGYLSRDNIRDLWEAQITSADNLEKICKEKNISLIKKKKGESYNELDDLQEAADNDAGKKISEEHPDRQKSPEEIAKEPHIIAVAKVITDLEVIKNALIDFPIPEGDQLAIEIEESFDALHLVLQHSSDKKFRRSLLQWNDILYEAAEQGGTSAASHSGVECAGLTDTKTGRPLFRNITKEQIDAIKLPMYNKMNRIIHGLPGLGRCLVAIDEHLTRFEEKWRERRCALLSPKLQKKA